MTLSLRRVVTGHDQNGKAKVIIDEQVKNVKDLRPGASASVIWSTKGFPADNDGNEDTSARKVATSEQDGTVFRVIEFSPGVTPRNHRTDSIDYAVIISGSIRMLLDDSEVTLRAGDVMVQRGTVHNWIVEGPEPCVIAFVLIGAKSVTIDGKPLPAHG